MASSLHPFLCAAALAVCTLAQADSVEALRPFSNARSEQPPAPWHFTSLPNKTPTRFEVVQQGNQRVLKVEADQSYGNLVHRTLVPLQSEPTLAWRWRVDQFVQGADLRTKAGDDGAAKLCVFFDFPADRLSFAERAKLTLARAASGEDVPSEVLCYVWDNKEPKGTSLVNAFTNRMRMLVLEFEHQHAHAVGEGVDQRRALGLLVVPDVAEHFARHVLAAGSAGQRELGALGKREPVGRKVEKHAELGCAVVAGLGAQVGALHELVDPPTPGQRRFALQRHQRPVHQVAIRLVGLDLEHALVALLYHFEAGWRLVRQAREVPGRRRLLAAGVGKRPQRLDRIGLGQRADRQRGGAKKGVEAAGHGQASFGWVRGGAECCQIVLF